MQHNLEARLSDLRYKYDSLGRLQEQFYIEDEEITNKTHFTYNIQNDIILQIDYDKEGNIIRKIEFSYTYDKVGNWTQMTRIVDGDPELIVQAVIEYYE